MARNFGSIKAVAEAVGKPDQDRLDREPSRRERSTLKRIREIVRVYQAKPVVDPRPGDEFLYDELGLPK